jgi:hypothetical protein
VVRVRYQYHMMRNISVVSGRVRYQYHMMRNISGKSEISISHDEKH